MLPKSTVLELSLLVPALEHRNWKLIVEEVQRQATPHAGRVEVIVDVDNGEATSGVKRQRLLRKAQGLYVAYVDDDDRVASDYVSSLLEGISQRPDVVTFDLEFQRSSQKRRYLGVSPVARKRGLAVVSSQKVPLTELWRYGLHSHQRAKGQMTANHLCAWNRSIASAVSWCPCLGYADDQLWYGALFKSGLATSEVHIDKVLYFYQYSSSATANQTNDRKTFSLQYVGKGLRCFRSEELGLLVEVGGSRRCREPNRVLVRDSDCIEHYCKLSELEHYHTLRIR